MIESTFLKAYYGKTVVQLFRTDYMFNGKVDEENFGSLQINFSDNSVLTFKENGDAESISISNEPILFGGDIGDWQKIILNDLPGWSSLINSKVIHSSLLENKYNNRTWVCGCRLIFENQISLTYFNYYYNAKAVFGEDQKLKSFIEYENLNWTS